MRFAILFLAVLLSTACSKNAKENRTPLCQNFVKSGGILAEEDPTILGCSSYIGDGRVFKYTDMNVIAKKTTFFYGEHGVRGVQIMLYMEYRSRDRCDPHFIKVARITFPAEHAMAAQIESQAEEAINSTRLVSFRGRAERSPSNLEREIVEICFDGKNWISLRDFQ